MDAIDLIYQENLGVPDKPVKLNFNRDHYIDSNQEYLEVRGYLLINNTIINHDSFVPILIFFSDSTECMYSDALQLFFFSL